MHLLCSLSNSSVNATLVDRALCTHRYPANPSCLCGCFFSFFEIFVIKIIAIKRVVVVIILDNMNFLHSLPLLVRWRRLRSLGCCWPRQLRIHVLDRIFEVIVVKIFKPKVVRIFDMRIALRDIGLWKWRCVDIWRRWLVMRSARRRV